MEVLDRDIKDTPIEDQHEYTITQTQEISTERCVHGASIVFVPVVYCTCKDCGWESAHMRVKGRAKIKFDLRHVCN